MQLICHLKKSGGRNKPLRCLRSFDGCDLAAFPAAVRDFQIFFFKKICLTAFGFDKSKEADE